jgi:thiamine kinase-like enzyme
MIDIEKKHIYIKNKDGKEWFFDTRDIRNSLCLYQPSSFKGKLIKVILPSVKHFSITYKIILRLIGAKYSDYALSQDLLKFICDTFNISPEMLRYSVFGGTLCKHQKTTIQICNKNLILGYCKISSDDKIGELFEHEAEILEYLNSLHIGNIPKCLFCGKLSKTSYIFVQSTNKNVKSKFYNAITNQIVSFERSIMEKTICRCNFIDSDYCKMLDSLEEKLGIIEKYFRNFKFVVKEAINFAKTNLKFKSDYYFSHRDFTPWNIYYTDDKLFVFDFEYARKSYPEFVDLFHFFTQSMFFEFRFSPERVYEKFLKSVIFQTLCDQPQVFYLYYLLDYIELYLSREKDTWSCKIEEEIALRMQLLRFCLDDIKGR